MPRTTVAMTTFIESGKNEANIVSYKRKASSQHTGETSRPSLTKKMRKDKFLPISDPEYSVVLGDVSSYASKFTSKDKIEEVISSFNICCDAMVDFVAIKYCVNSDRVFMNPPRDARDFTFVYEYFFKEINITFPFPPFECCMLNAMNMAPSQLHPNKWAFSRAFQILSTHLQSLLFQLKQQTL